MESALLFVAVILDGRGMGLAVTSLLGSLPIPVLQFLISFVPHRHGIHAGDHS